MQLDSKTPLGNAPLALEQINESHRQFWSEQSKLMDERISDETTFKLALDDMRSETMRQVPVKSQKSLEQALADAAMARSTVQRGFSRKGGGAHKSDALQDLILEIVHETPRITAGRLARVLGGSRGAGVIVSIDKEPDILADEPRMIHFVDDNGTLKTASLSGLKDRLFRPTREIASR
jgi:hypothetical protein